MPENFEIPVSVQYVYYGYKPVTLIHGGEFYLTALLHWAEESGIFGILSPFEFDYLSDSRLNSYTNVITKYRHAQSGSGAWRGLLISYDVKMLALAWIALIFNNDSELGNCLGYPRCCIDRFSENWKKAVESEMGDLSMRALKNSGNVIHYWGANIFARYFGFEFIQHFPCNLSCEKTIELAQSYERCLQLYDPVKFQQYREFLSCIVIVSKNDGVILLREAKYNTTGTDSTGKDIYFISYTPDKLYASNPSSELFKNLCKTDVLAYYQSCQKVKLGSTNFHSVLVSIFI